MFDTAEFLLSPGLGEINAIPAYEAGLTGQGVIVGIIDSGLDATNIEFSRRLLPESRNFVELDQAMIDSSGHGTRVTGIIAAEKNDIGIHGVAFEASILALRVCAATPTDPFCNLPGEDITAPTLRVIDAIDHAILAGANVINISLGFDATDLPDGPERQSFMDALQRAVDAGILLVFAAGNDFADDPQEIVSNMALDPALENGVLIVGSTDRSQVIFDRSNKAGFAQAVFLVAPSQVISTANGGGTGGTSNGTSFAAPHVSGAAALLFELFPNLTGQEVGEILLLTATDLGDPGVDPIYGHGLLNLAAAILPVGTTTVAVQTQLGGVQMISMASTGLQVSSAFGDAFQGMTPLGQVMMLDGFRRSFFIDLASQVRRSRPIAPDLDHIINSRRAFFGGTLIPAENASITLSAYDPNFRNRRIAGALPMAFQMQQGLRRPSFGFAFTLDEKTRLSLDSGGSVASPGAGFDLPRNLTFLTSADGLELLSNPSGRLTRLELSRELSGKSELALTFSGSRYGGRRSLGFGQGPGGTGEASVMRWQARYGRQISRARIAATGGLIAEKGAVLASISGGALSLGRGAETLFGRLDFALDMGRNVWLTGRYSAGLTSVKGIRGSLVQGLSRLRISEFSASLTKTGIFSGNDRLGLSFAQPLRVDGGRAGLNIATGRDYSTDTLSFTRFSQSLAPSGREFDLELSYQLMGRGGARLSANLLHQFRPGHRAGATGITSLLLTLNQAF